MNFVQSSITSSVYSNRIRYKLFNGHGPIDWQVIPTTAKYFFHSRLYIGESSTKVLTGMLATCLLSKNSSIFFVLVVFPINTPHYTQRNTLETERIAIAGNIIPIMKQKEVSNDDNVSSRT